MQNYEPGAAFFSDIVLPIRAQQITKTTGANKEKGKELYFIAYIDVPPRYPYIAPLSTHDKTAQLTNKFLTTLTKKLASHRNGLLQIMLSNTPVR